PPGGAAPNGALAQVAAAVVEVRERLPHREVAGGADGAAPQAPRREARRGPAPEPAHRGQRLDDLLVGPRRERDEVELALIDTTGEADDVLGLAAAELHPPQLAHTGPREGRRLGERVEGLAAHADHRAVPAYERSPQGEGEGQVDLLGADRPHQHL